MRGRGLGLIHERSSCAVAAATASAVGRVSGAASLRAPANGAGHTPRPPWAARAIPGTWNSDGRGGDLKPGAILPANPKAVKRRM